MITTDQIRTIKTAQRQLKMDDGQYRILLRNIGGVDSCKNLDQKSFEDVMATFESMGFVGPRKNYWSDIVLRRGSFASSRQVHRIQELCCDYESMRGPTDPHYELGGLVFNASGGKTRDPSRLLPKEAHNLIEQLKSMIDRLDATATYNAEVERDLSLVNAGTEIPF